MCHYTVDKRFFENKKFIYPYKIHKCKYKYKYKYIYIKNIYKYIYIYFLALTKCPTKIVDTIYLKRSLNSGRINSRLCDEVAIHL